MSENPIIPSNFSNEPIFDFAPNSEERKKLKAKIHELKSQSLDVPMVINGKEVFTNNKITMHPPHELNHVLGTYNVGNAEHVNSAIEAALEAKENWSSLPWNERADIFLKAADLISGEFRYELLASTMLAQSKNAYQAEIDAACELADFLRFNVQYLQEIYAKQPSSTSEVNNSMEYRPLEGFVFAITPFNFTAIAGNLCAAPALMGNTVVWKPADSQIYSAHFIMKMFKLAGLPDGVINLITVDGPAAGDIVFNHRDFAGLHFTGSTKVFKHLWKTIGSNIDKYRTYPRIVGETGGKDFILAHKSCDVKALETAIIRGAFEFQGQKCSAASRAYIPSSIWNELKGYILNDLKQIKVGTVEQFDNFVNAVIDRNAFTRIAEYLDFAKSSKDCEILAGGKYDDSEGYFVEPTIIIAKSPDFKLMKEEIFGPVITIYIYSEDEEKTITKVVDETSEYALTGAIFSEDEGIIQQWAKELKFAAGNFYINDKPTGAVVDQQPFGGGRGSGTNDKAGSYLNLLRWVSPRTIKENLNPPHDFRYPFLEE